jgi:hypothetical protein
VALGSERHLAADRMAADRLREAALLLAQVQGLKGCTTLRLTPVTGAILTADTEGTEAHIAVPSKGRPTKGGLRPPASIGTTRSPP